MRAKTLVLSAERSPQSRLLIDEHKQVRHQPPKHSIHQHPRIPQKQSLPKNHGHNRDIHRIPHVAVKPLDHQMSRGEDRSRRTNALQRKPCERIQHHDYPRSDQHHSHHSKRHKAEERRAHLPSRNPPGNPPHHCPWSQQQKNRRPHDGQPTPPTTGGHVSVHANLLPLRPTPLQNLARIRIQFPGRAILETWLPPRQPILPSRQPPQPPRAPRRCSRITPPSSSSASPPWSSSPPEQASTLAASAPASAPSISASSRPSPASSSSPSAPAPSIKLSSASPTS